MTIPLTRKQVFKPALRDLIYERANNSWAERSLGDTIPVLRDTVTPTTVSMGQTRRQGCNGITWGPFCNDAVSTAC